MSEPLSSELLARYLASQANTEERAIVDAWAAATPANASDLAHMRKVWESRGSGVSWDVDSAWKKVQARTHRAPTMGTQISGAPNAVGGMLLKIAAGLVLVAGGTFGYIKLSPLIGAPPQTYTTAVGEKKDLDLADSTHVVLGPMSELRVVRGFNRKERRVDLVGQAWFVVKHDSTMPFRVHALGAITEDLGTSFAVRATARDSVVNVVVTEGIVSVHMPGTAPAAGAVLKPNDVVDLDARTAQAHITRGVAAEQLVAWHTGRLEFINAPLSEIAAELARWYGVTVKFDKPEMGRRPVSYSMPTNSLDDVIKVISASMMLHVERKGDTLFVR